MGLFTFILSWVFIDIGSFCQELRFYEINKIFELERSCWLSEIFMSYYLIVCSLLCRSLRFIFIGVIVSLRCLSLRNTKGGSELTVYNNGRLKLKPHIHVIGVNWKVILLLVPKIIIWVVLSLIALELY